MMIIPIRLDQTRILDEVRDRARSCLS